MTLDLPDRLWTLMEIGVGGYIIGRTAENKGGGVRCNPTLYAVA